MSVAIVKDGVAPGKQISIRELEFIKTESFCPMEVQDVENDESDKYCDVFVDHEIKGLSLSHLIVKRYFASDNGFLGLNNNIPPKLIYRYSEQDFWQILESGSSSDSSQTKLMNGDYRISLDDGQSLTLSKMTFITD